MVNACAATLKIALIVSRRRSKRRRTAVTPSSVIQLGATMIDARYGINARDPVTDFEKASPIASATSASPQRSAVESIELCSIFGATTISAAAEQIAAVTTSVT